MAPEKPTSTGRRKRRAGVRSAMCVIDEGAGLGIALADRCEVD
jgi:hypothetical protein